MPVWSTRNAASTRRTILQILEIQTVIDFFWNCAFFALKKMDETHLLINELLMCRIRSLFSKTEGTTDICITQKHQPLNSSETSFSTFSYHREKSRNCTILLFEILMNGQLTKDTHCRVSKYVFRSENIWCSAMLLMFSFTTKNKSCTASTSH